MKLKTVNLAISTFMWSTALFAEPTHKEKVLQTVKNFALATSCQTTFEKSEHNNFGKPELSNTYISYTTTDNVYLGINKYFVLWGGFDGCSIAATGENFTYNLTEVEYNETANRFIIINPNIITEVENEYFFTLANIQFFEELEHQNYKLSLYMFNENDIDKKTDRLKDSAKPSYYQITLQEVISSTTDGKYKVIEKNRIGY